MLSGLFPVTYDRKNALILFLIFFLVGLWMGSQFLNGNKTMVLVTGGLGFIGSHVVEDLMEDGYQVVVYDDMSNGRNVFPGSSVYVNDIVVVSDLNLLPTGIKYVVHLAAAISVAESMKMPDKYDMINVEGSMNVLKWARENGVKHVVAASSAAVYGVPKQEDIPIKESIAGFGISPYAASKYKMEIKMKKFSEETGIPSTGLRFFNVYGPRQNPKSDYSGVISHFLDKVHNEEDIGIYGDGEQYRDFVYVKDVSKAIRTALFSPLSGFNAFNVCTGKKTTINELATTLIEMFEASIQISHLPDRDGDIRESLCDPSFTTTKLGFTAHTDMKTGLSKTKSWIEETF
jgi:UDP-glucose 4-epimerase